MSAVTTTLRGASAMPEGGAAAHSPGKLAAAAREFESVLLGQWLQSAGSSFGTVPGADEDTDAGGDQMQSFGMQKLAGELTASGGIGIARLVERGLEKASARDAAGASTSDGAAGNSADRVAGNQRAAFNTLTYAAEAKP